jgi:hypothetical protein
VTNLNVSASVVLNASGGGQVAIGPQNTPGTQSWNVSGILVKTSRPGVAPIPACDVYLDSVDPGSIVATMYDGSRNQGPGDQILVQGQRLIAVWAGGQSGDVATLVLSGTRGSSV